MKKKIVYQGCRGAYGHIAALNFAKRQEGKSDFDIYSVQKFEYVINEVLSGNADFGILPLENSKTGGILEVLDILLETDLYIVGEEIVNVVHNLLGSKDACINDIKTVVSHPQAFSQCKEFISNYGDEWQIVLKLNTAESAKVVFHDNDKSLGAIASAPAAEIYGLQILKEAINDSPNNSTRFVLIGSKPLDKEEHINKCSIIFSVSNKCGALVEVLSIFKDHNLNLTKIESHPDPSRKFGYIFFADLEGDFSFGNTDMDKVFGQIAQKSRHLKILGFYEKNDNE